jgi:hypothetical protein
MRASDHSLTIHHLAAYHEDTKIAKIYGPAACIGMLLIGQATCQATPLEGRTLVVDVTNFNDQNWLNGIMQPPEGVSAKTFTNGSGVFNSEALRASKAIFGISRS